MFVKGLLLSIALTLHPSQQCDRNSTNAAIKSVVSRIEDLSWVLKNNISEAHQNTELASSNIVQGRGHKDYGLLYLIPLLVGTKTAGLTAAAFTVIKLFIIQAFVFSKLALLSLMYLVLKKLLQYNSIHVYKTVGSPPHLMASSSSSFPSLHDYMPSGLSAFADPPLTSSGSSDGLHSSSDASNPHYSTILSAGDSHGFANHHHHQENSESPVSGFSPSSELTGLGAHAAPDLQGQFTSLTSQSKAAALRSSNETANKADDRLFRTHPHLIRRRIHQPMGLTHVGGVTRHRMAR